MSAKPSDAIRAQILFLLALAALAEFAVADVGILLHQLDVPEALRGLAARQQGLAAFLRNLLLVAGALVLAGLLPGMVRRRRRRPLLEEGQALLALGLLGALAVNALARSGVSLAVANLLVTTLALFASVRILRGAEALAARIPVALLVAACCLPQLWRAALEFGGGEEGATATLLRRAADLGLPLAWALSFLLIIGLPRRRKIAVLAVAATAAGLTAMAPADAAQLLATVTGLWFSSWPPLGLIAAVGLGSGGLAAALLGPRRAALALAYLLLACSGFRPTGAGELLLLAIAVLLLGDWAEGRGGRVTDLGRLLF